MSQNETTTVLVTDAKNLTLIDATRENSPWWWWWVVGGKTNFSVQLSPKLNNRSRTCLEQV